MIEDITMDTIVFVGQVTNPVSQGSPIVSIPVANPPTVKRNVQLNATIHYLFLSKGLLFLAYVVGPRS